MSIDKLLVNGVIASPREMDNLVGGVTDPLDLTTAERERLIRVLQDAVWPFLAHDPDRPDVFWGAMARSVEAHFAPRLGEAREQLATANERNAYGIRATDDARAEADRYARQVETARRDALIEFREELRKLSVNYPTGWTGDGWLAGVEECMNLAAERAETP